MRTVRFQRGFFKDNVSKGAFSKDSVPFLRFDFLTLIQLIFSFNNNKNELSDKPTHDRGQSLLPSLSGNAAHPEPHPSPHPLADVHAAVESQDFSYTSALPRTAAHQPVHGAGKGRDTLYEGMETERAGENNARMAATAVRGDKTGTVERILMANEE